MKVKCTAEQSRKASIDNGVIKGFNACDKLTIGKIYEASLEYSGSNNYSQSLKSSLQCKFYVITDDDGTTNQSWLASRFITLDIIRHLKLEELLESDP